MNEKNVKLEVCLKCEMLLSRCDEDGTPLYVCPYVCNEAAQYPVDAYQLWSYCETANEYQKAPVPRRCHYDEYHTGEQEMTKRNVEVCIGCRYFQLFKNGSLCLFTCIEPDKALCKEKYEERLVPCICPYYSENTVLELNRLSEDEEKVGNMP